MNSEPFITCAVTGAGDTAGKHPDLPITPQQIADAALEAGEAGAAVVHLHVRDPQTGAPSRDTALYREAVEKVRAGNPELLINLTTGMGGDLVVGEDPAAGPAPGSDLVGAMERIVHVEELRPDICTLDMGSMNFDDDSLVYVAPPTYLRQTADRLRELGVKPEMEVFDLGHLELAKTMIAEGLFDSPAFLQFCHGIPYGAPATEAALTAMRAHLPETPTVWSAFAVGRMQMAFVELAANSGGNVRVGLEDNLYLERGVLASNAELVAKAREILEGMGAAVAGPAQVRERLKLSQA